MKFNWVLSKYSKFGAFSHFVLRTSENEGFCIQNEQDTNCVRVTFVLTGCISYVQGGLFSKNGGSFGYGGNNSGKSVNVEWEEEAIFDFSAEDAAVLIETRANQVMAAIVERETSIQVSESRFGWEVLKLPFA